MKKPEITPAEREIWHRFLLKNGYVEGDGKGKMELTMKGQQMLIILNEFKKHGQVQKLDNRWVEKHGVTKFGEFLLEIIWKRSGRD